jgi:hypothetical protein
MGLENLVYVVDYDIPTGNPTKRVDFYRKVHRLLREHYDKEHVTVSSKSCYFTTDKELAEKFLEIVKKYGKGNLWKAEKQ